MRMKQVQDHFENEALEYDALIVKLIPGYAAQNEVIRRELIAYDRPVRKAVDLGCGTGVFARILLETHPESRVLLFDLAERMLKVAGAALAAYADRVAFQQGNFGEVDFGSGYDVVLSGLAIHHLEDPDKRKIFRRIKESLNPGGIFLLRDFIRYATPEETQREENAWRVFMRANGMDDAHFHALAKREDRPSTVEEQMKWMEEAGFAEVRRLYQENLGAVMSARRPE